MKHLIKGAAAIFAVIIVFWLSGRVGASAQLAVEDSPNPFGLAGYLINEVFDWRAPLHGSQLKLETCETKGLFLFVRHGRFKDAVLIPTNECPTPEAAFKKFGVRIPSQQPQIRIVQRDSIIQTPMMLTTQSAAAEKKILTLPLNAGDVVLVTRVQ